MKTKFNIIYAIRFFCGKLETGTVEVSASPDAKKEDIEFVAMSLVKNRISPKSKEHYPSANDMWIENAQKIDLTVTQIS
ncbi:hypothetical protein [Sphingobacterium multivorum]|uniref:hypothetical protein n=1 Tax=Sphingobacterium multivorum TaxID=28454 RepID=UPI00289D7BCB|nr:hypothetical protein [Sphingobacterium multivorum]